MIKSILILLAILLPDSAHADCSCTQLGELQKALSMSSYDRMYVEKIINYHTSCRCKNSLNIFFSVAEDKSSPYMIDAISAIGIIGGPKARSFLSNQLGTLRSLPQTHETSTKENSDLIIMIYTSGALCKTGDSSYVQFVMNNITNKNKSIRYHAAKSLGMIDTPLSRKMLWEIIQYDTMDLPKCAAVDSLIELNDPDILNFIKNKTHQNNGIECFRDHLP